MTGNCSGTSLPGTDIGCGIRDTNKWKKRQIYVRNDKICRFFLIFINPAILQFLALAFSKNPCIMALVDKNP